VFRKAGAKTNASYVTTPAAPPDPETTTTPSVEARGARARRYASRTRLYTWAVLTAVLLVLFVVLVAENTRRVRVGWVFGYSRVSLVFLVVFATLLGWLLGIATSVIFRRRTRRPDVH
jgi:uncharacterized integral membrane protein